MPEILRGRLKIKTDNTNQLYPTYQTMYPETCSEQIVDFEKSVITSINHVIKDALNIENQEDGTKLTTINDLKVNNLRIDAILSDRDNPVDAIVKYALADEEGNNIVQTYATKDEMDSLNISTSQIVDFVDNVNGLIINKIQNEGLDQFLSLQGGNISGSLKVNGVLTASTIIAQAATDRTTGLVRIGNNINYDTTGRISINQADTENLGVTKLYQSRGDNTDGPISQKAFETALNDYATVAENLFLQKTDLIDKARCDEYGNRIADTYMTKENMKRAQVNKLGIVASNANRKEIVFDITDNSFNYSPVEVLKLNADGEDRTETICNFDNSDASSFIIDENPEDDFRSIRFDGTMKILTEYDIHMSELIPCADGYISYSSIIDLNKFRQKKEVNIFTSEGISYKLFISNDSVYNTTGVLITDNWNALTDNEKQTLFYNFKNSVDTYVNENVFSLPNIQVIAYTENADAVLSGNFIGLPNKKVVIPKGLIPASSFITILNANMIYNLSGLADVKIVVTNDLENWYTYNFNTAAWELISTEFNESTGRYVPTAETMSNRGISVKRLNEITSWSLFSNNIGFAYLLDIFEPGEICNVDQLDLVVTARGSWAHYNKVSYTYTTNKLIIYVYDSGDYKINYQK